MDGAGGTLRLVARVPPAISSIDQTLETPALDRCARKGGGLCGGDASIGHRAAHFVDARPELRTQRMRPVDAHLTVLVVKAAKCPGELRSTDVTQAELHLELGKRSGSKEPLLLHCRPNAHSKVGITGHNFLLIVEVQALSSFAVNMCLNWHM